MVGSVWLVYVLPAALHGIEASLLASDSLRKLRSAICKVVWSRRQPLANVGAVLSLLDGPTGCALLFAWFGLGFACFVAILLFGLLRSMVGEGCPGRLLLIFAAKGFSVWASVGYPWVFATPCFFSCSGEG